MALVSRDGCAHAMPIKLGADTLKGEIRARVNENSRIITDDSNLYGGIGEDFAGGHHSVNHSKGEYTRGDVHTNTVESFFALLKRGHYGTFHKLSKKHMHRYCSEFAFRWNHRKIKDSDRCKAAIRGVGGKRLMYREPRQRGDLS